MWNLLVIKLYLVLAGSLVPMYLFIFRKREKCKDCYFARLMVMRMLFRIFLHLQSHNGFKTSVQ